jgi:tetratricopeptide (TPR) repeat protein
VARLAEEIAARPDDAELRLLLATAHAEHAEWELCLEEVARISALDPAVRTGHLSGKSHLGKGDLDTALADLDAFLAAEAAHRDALASRARVLLRLGRGEEALADYLAALEGGADAELHVEAIEALRRLGRRDEAHLLAEEAVARTGGDPSVLVCAIGAATESGKVDAALAHIDVLVRTWPRPEPWMMEKAELLAEAGRAGESRAAWRELHEHLMALPNLERAQPFLAGPLAAARRALGIVEPTAVVAPPSSR